MVPTGKHRAQNRVGRRGRRSGGRSVWLVVLLLVLSLGVLPSNARAVNFGERSDWEVQWSYISTWPYGSEQFTAAARFKGGDGRIVFAGTSGRVAIYDSNTRTWQALGKWPQGTQWWTPKILAIAVRDGNTSIVFAGERGRYAVLEHVSGSWQWVASGIWPPGESYYYYDYYYSNDILAASDKPSPNDNAVVLGGVNGDVAILGENNQFVASFKWAHYGEGGGRGRITKIIPWDNNMLLLLGRNGGSWLGLAAQFLNANNTLGSSNYTVFSGIAQGARRDSNTFWWLSENNCLGYGQASPLSVSTGRLLYVGFQGVLAPWANGSVFIGGNRRYTVVRYDNAFGKSGSAPVNIVWAEAQNDGSVLVAGDGALYYGTTYPSGVELPTVEKGYPGQSISTRIYKRPGGGWDLWVPIRQSLTSYTVPDGGTMRDLVFSYRIYYTTDPYSYDGPYALRLWGYRTGSVPNDPERADKVLVAQITGTLPKGSTVSNTVTVAFPEGITYLEFVFELDSEPALDDYGYYDVTLSIDELRYFVYKPKSVNLRWDSGYSITWEMPRYASTIGQNLQYAVVRDGTTVRDWDGSASFFDGSASMGQPYRYEIRVRYRGSATYKSVAIPEDVLLTADTAVRVGEAQLAALEARDKASEAKALAELAASRAYYNGQSAAYWAYLASQGGVDVTPPVIEKLRGKNGATATTTGTFWVEVTARDDRPGQLQARAQVNGGAWTGWYDIPQNFVPVTLPVAGANTITVEVRDAAGNVARATMTAFKL